MSSDKSLLQYLFGPPSVAEIVVNVLVRSVMLLATGGLIGLGVGLGLKLASLIVPGLLTGGGL